MTHNAYISDEALLTGAVLLTIAAAAALIFAFFVYIRSRKTLDKIDSMLDDAIAGTFAESSFTEQQLSKIESKLYRYLNKGTTSLKQINSEKDAIKTLISDISHQTKTSVSNILIYSQLLCEAKDLDDDTRKLALQTEAQAQKLNFLISALVKVSRLENGILTTVPKRNSVKTLIESLDFQNIADEKRISLSIKSECGAQENSAAPAGPSVSPDTGSNAGPSADIYAYFDFKWTLEALSNIVDNALKYTPAGGSVSVCVKEYEMFICIDVTDTGIGISEADTAKIFSRFYRADSVSDKPGVGIGLYLAREIVSRNGGYIKVKSEVGHGSTFSVFLPKQHNLSAL